MTPTGTAVRWRAYFQFSEDDDIECKASDADAAAEIIYCNAPECDSFHS